LPIDKIFPTNHFGSLSVSLVDSVLSPE